MVERSRRSSGATLAAARAALEDGVGVNLAQRDRMVFDLCHASGVPVAVTMAGGYARRIEDTAEIHFATVRIAAEFARRGAR